MDAGAAWRELTIGIEHPTRWKRVEVRVFPTAESAAARAWMAAAWPGRA